jgi:hypothetical protein
MLIWAPTWARATRERTLHYVARRTPEAGPCLKSGVNGERRLVALADPEVFVHSASEGGIAALRRPRRCPHHGLYPGNGSNDVLHTGAPDPPNLSCGADVGDGIAIDQYEVGPSAGFDHASVV